MLRVFSPNFLGRKAQVTVTIKVRQSALYIYIVVKHWRALLSHKKCIRNHLRKSKIPKIFWGGMPPDPPSSRASRVWEPGQPRMASAGPILKLPSLQTLSLVVYKRVSGYNFFRARYIIIHLQICPPFSKILATPLGCKSAVETFHFVSVMLAMQIFLMQNLYNYGSHCVFCKL